MARSAEALERLKPQEARALWLRAQGNSYEEIQRQTGWTRTKVNRCLYEGRRSFLERYAGIESGAECRRWEPLLSALVDGEATTAELRELRPHLRRCPACRAAVRELQRSAAPLRVVFPAGAVLIAADHAEPAGHLFVKVYDTVTTWLGERAASSFVRAQILVDGVSASAGKATAVAAASAAVAGGGAVVVERAADRPGSAARVAAVAPVGRATSAGEARGSQRELTVAEQVEQRLASERRRARRAAAHRRARAARQASNTTTTASSAPASGATGHVAPAAAAPAPSAVTQSASSGGSGSSGAAAELGLE